MTCLFVSGKASSSKDENVDSGVSVDKSESTSSEGQAVVATEGPSNEVVSAAPSSSNVRAILLNIKRPRKGRNYRRIRTPDLDTDSDSSRDSDDVSADEAAASGSGPADVDDDNADDDNNQSDHSSHSRIPLEEIVARFTSTVTDSDGSE